MLNTGAHSLLSTPFANAGLAFLVSCNQLSGVQPFRSQVHCAVVKKARKPSSRPSVTTAEESLNRPRGLIIFQRATLSDDELTYTERTLAHFVFLALMQDTRG